LVQLAHGFQGGFQLPIVVQPLADLGHLVAVQADLAGAAAGIADAEDPDGMAAATITLGATLPMTDGALDQRSAEDEAQIGKTLEEAISLLGGAAMFHYY